jgi:hypothetical protein
MLLRAAIVGNLKAAMQAEVTRVAGAMRRAVTTAAQETQAELRRQARSGGFKDGGRAVANAWRTTVYPKAGQGRDTLKPAALVYSRMPDAVGAHDKGGTVNAKGGRYMAWPTGYNAAGGRRGAGRRGGLRVTPEQMIAAGRRNEAFVLRPKSGGDVALWCLRVAGASGTTRRTRNRLRLFVNTATEVGTGNRKGAAQRRRDLLQQGYVPMFFLAKRVSLRKRLDIAAVRAMAPRLYARAIVAELDRLAR